MDKVNQVVIWVTDSKQKVIVVSEKGVNWHLPSGLRLANESIPEASARIFKHTTGLSIDHCISQITTAGYYKTAEGIQVHTKVKCDLGDESTPTFQPAAAMARAIPIETVPVPD